MLLQMALFLFFFFMAKKIYNGQKAVGIAGCLNGYFLEALQWGRIKLGLLCEGDRDKRNCPVGGASHGIDSGPGSLTVS